MEEVYEVNSGNDLVVFDVNQAAEAIGSRNAELARNLKAAEAKKAALATRFFEVSESSFVDVVKRVTQHDEELQRLNAEKDEIMSKIDEIRGVMREDDIDGPPDQVKAKIQQAEEVLDKARSDKQNMSERLENSEGQSQFLIDNLREGVESLEKKVDQALLGVEEAKAKVQKHGELQAQIEDLESKLGTAAASIAGVEEELGQASEEQGELKAQLLEIGQELELAKAEYDTANGAVKTMRSLADTLDEIQDMGNSTNLGILGACMQDALFSVNSLSTGAVDMPRLFVLGASQPNQMYPSEDWTQEVQFELIFLCSYDFSPIPRSHWGSGGRGSGSGDASDQSSSSYEPIVVQVSGEDAKTLLPNLRTSYWFMKAAAIAELPVGEGLALPVPNVPGFPAAEANAKLSADALDMLCFFWPMPFASAPLEIDRALRANDGPETLLVQGFECILKLIPDLAEKLQQLPMQRVADKDGVEAWVHNDNVVKWQKSSAVERQSQLSSLLRRESAGQKFISRQKHARSS